MPRPIADGDPQTAYLALWAAAFGDAPAAIAQAQPLLSDADPARRYVAAHLLLQTNLPEANAALAPVLDDPDLRVALHVLRADFPGDVFEPLERLTARMPAKPKTLDALVWDWTAQVADRSAVADHLPKHLGKRSPNCLIPHLSAMSASGRSGAADALAKDTSGDPDVRDALLGLIGDASEYVRTKALTALAKAQITAGRPRGWRRC